MTEAESRHAELVTLVFEEYKKSFDLEIALDLVPLHDDVERAEIEGDSLLRDLMRHADAEERAKIVGRLQSLAYGANSEGVQLSALDKYGKMIYPKRFKESAPGDPDRPFHVQIIDDIPMGQTK